ncbi:MAG: SpoVR family protein [Chloroflexota bacterium]
MSSNPIMSGRELNELEKAIEQIWDIAIRLGLDPFPTHFEAVPANIMYEFGAYGLPGRFSHWTHGKAYQRMKMMYDYGLSKIYELVINTNPCYAFLMEGNGMLQNKLVAAHVLAHSDFFKNNLHFRDTSRQMLEGASINAERIRSYEFHHGRRVVEEFLDRVLCIEEHVDPNPALRQRDWEREKREYHPATPRETPYDDLFRMEQVEDTASEEEQQARHRRFPAEPEKDLLLFVAENAADLEDWQRDIIHIVRNEQLYFVPQMMTKIMNEGWASYWHREIMRELDLTSDEYVQFTNMNAAVTAPSAQQVNPYYVGLKIFESIKKRWDNPTEQERRELGRKEGEGLAKLFEVRELDSDVSFLRNYLTKELVDELDLYIYKREGDQWVIVEKDWQRIRDMLVASMTNFGVPYIVVEDGDHRRNRELYLRHSYEGQELDIKYAERTLQAVFDLWGRPVHVETVVEDRKLLISYDGQRHTQTYM